MDTSMFTILYCELQSRNYPNPCPHHGNASLMRIIYKNVQPKQFKGYENDFDQENTNLFVSLSLCWIKMNDCSRTITEIVASYYKIITSLVYQQWEHHKLWDQ